MNCTNSPQNNRLTEKQDPRVVTYEVDYSDIPHVPESFWKNAARNPFYRPVKRQVTVRLDADVIARLSTQGKGYQTRINHLLRATMLQDVVK
jgi:uncharacterized protein (DUF4415 family)